MKLSGLIDTVNAIDEEIMITRNGRCSVGFNPDEGDKEGLRGFENAKLIPSSLAEVGRLYRLSLSERVGVYTWLSSLPRPPEASEVP